MAEVSFLSSANSRKRASASRELFFEITSGSGPLSSDGIFKTKFTVPFLAMVNSGSHIHKSPKNVVKNFSSQGVVTQKIFYFK